MKYSFEQMLAEFCAPTLAGVKPATLFRYRPEPGEDVNAHIAYWDAALRPQGVTVQALKQCQTTGAALVYVYRHNTLARLLAAADIREFLRSEGYTATALEPLLRELAQRVCCEGDFPHEIGVFLGYPLEDVVGFIRNQGKNYLCCGYWKVYGDADAAQRCFARYKKCEQVYKRLHQNGTPLRKLTVAA